MQLTIELLGGLSLKIDDTRVTTLISQKAYVLLAYLAHTQQAHTREALATLFWPDTTPKQALSNLRTILTSIRRHLEPFVDITAKSVALKPETDIWVDSIILEKVNLSDVAPSDLQTALSLYKGGFLDGIFVNDSFPLEDWIGQTRTDLHDLAITGYQQLVSHYTQWGDYEAGWQAAYALLKLDPAHEEIHQALMLMLARQGQYQAVTEQYEQCQTALQEELGVEVDPETTILHDWLLTAQGMPTFTLPIPLTSFVGRAEPLQQLNQQFAQQTKRATTLVGLGGSGKTRLALEAGQRFQHLFLHGSLFVSLVYVQTAVDIPFTIAEQLQLVLRGNRSPLDQLKDYLRNKEMLIILDNCEHLLTSEESPTLIESVQTILAESPKVRFLLTSREPLSFAENQVIELSGLPYQSDKEEQATALDLFVQRGQVVNPQFALTPENQPAIHKICQIVEGLPLGVELAAAWVHALSSEQIGQYIEQNLDMLTSQRHDIPPRQRSLRAVFDSVWVLLSAKQQELLERLGVFAGGFTLEASIEITNASQEALAELVERAVLQVDENGRYHLIEALRLYIIEKLDADALLYQETQDKHSHYYFDLLMVTSVNDLGDLQETNNLWSAWSWAIQQGNYALVNTVVVAFSNFIHAKGLYQQGKTQLLTSLNVLKSQQQVKDEVALQIAIARLLSMIARLYSRIDYVTGYQYADEAFTLAERIEDGVSLAEGALQKGRSSWLQGVYDQAEIYLKQAIVYAQKYDLPYVEADANLELGIIDVHQDNYDQAKHFFSVAQTIFQQIGDKHGQQSAAGNLGVIHVYQGDLQEAQRVYSQAYDLLPDSPIAKTVLLGNLTSLEKRLGYYQESLVKCREILQATRITGDRRLEAWNLSFLGNTLLPLGQYLSAIAWFDRAQKLSMDIGNRSFFSTFLLESIQPYRQLGQFTEAIELAQQALAIKQELEETRKKIEALNELSLLFYWSDQLEQAHKANQQALEMAKELNYAPSLGDTLLIHGTLLMGQDTIAAGEVFDQIDPDYGQGEPLATALLHAGLGTCALLQNDLTAVRPHLAQVEQNIAVLHQLQTDSQVYLHSFCAHAWQALSEPEKAEQARAKADTIINNCLALIPEEMWRQTYLNHVQRWQQQVLR